MHLSGPWFPMTKCPWGTSVALSLPFCLQVLELTIHQPKWRCPLCQTHFCTKPPQRVLCSCLPLVVARNMWKVASQRSIGLISCLKFGTPVPDILAVLSVQISADVMAATEPPPRQKACAPKDVPTMRNLSPRPSNTISNPCDILKRHTIIASTSFGQNILKLEAEPQALDLKP
jgi:hypothetical protein